MKVDTTFDRGRTELIMNLVEQKKFAYLKELGIKTSFKRGKA